MSVWSHDFGTTRDPARRWAFDKMLRNSTDLRYIDRCMQPDTSEPFRLAAVRVMGPCRSERVTGGQRAVVNMHRAATGMTVNHAYEHRQHIEAKSDGYSPGPPIPPRREVMPAVIEWGIAILAALVIVFVVASFVYTFQHLNAFFAY